MLDYQIVLSIAHGPSVQFETIHASQIENSTASWPR